MSVTLTYSCTVGPCAGSRLRTADIVLGPRETRVLVDVVARVFSASESAGHVDLSWPGNFGSAFPGFLLVSSKTSTQDPDSGGTRGFGTAGEEQFYWQHAVFVGVAGGGGDPTKGFRTNINLDPYGGPGNVTLTLYDSSGRVLGSPLGVSLDRSVQINDVFTAVGAAGSATSSATLVVDGDRNFFTPFVTVIDNRSGDSVLLTPFIDPSAYEAGPPAVRIWGSIVSNDSNVSVARRTVTVVQDGIPHTARTGEYDGGYQVTGLRPTVPVRVTVSVSGACPDVTYDLWLGGSIELNPIICAK